jgi:hypothetical protein
MFLHVTSAKYLGEYRLRLEFNDGSRRDVDLSGALYGEIFLPLRDVDYFRTVYVNQETGTIEWPNGADFAPEFLHASSSQTAGAFATVDAR